MKVRQFISIIPIIAVALILSACGGGGGGGGEGEGEGGGGGAPATATFTSGIRHEVVAAQTIDASGGTITAPADSPLAGVVVNIPAGALSSPRQISLSYDDGMLTTVNGSPGKVISLDAGEGAQFGQPVHITVPTDGNIVAPYYIDGSGHLHLVQISSIDRVNHTITFDTFHASLFTWIFGIETAYAPDGMDTSFKPGEDGFQVDNLGSTYNRGGECMGMSSFSLWYFENRKQGDGNFYPRFMTAVGTDSDGRSIVGQNVIATRAFISIAQQWNTYVPTLDQESGLTDYENYVIIRDAIINTGNPVMISLRPTDTVGGHSVLAIGANEGEIKIYDNNYHNQVKTITYNSATNAFDQYEGHTRMLYFGDGSLFLTEPYQSILDDANANFASSANATVSVQSPTSGQTVTNPYATLTGHIDSSQVLVERLKVFVGSTEFKVNVDQTGDFSIAVTLSSGTNHLQFVTQGRDVNGNYIDIPNNLATTDFTVIANMPTTAILVTLTWDTNDTDIDTYVIDPTGDYSAYYHEQSADGGYLDYDVTTGYGPEHWLLTTENTVRYGQDYRVRLHYYSDHGNGPSNYTVAIQIGDGAAATTTYYRGNLAVSNSSNDAPTDTGSDWVDIATIRPVAPAQGQSAQAVRPQIASATRGGPVLITVPVPSVEQRAIAKRSAKH